MEGWNCRVSQRDCCPQMAEGLLRRQLANRPFQSDVIIAPFIPYQTCSLRDLDVPEISLENPHSGNYWFYFHQHCTHSGEFWESIFPGGVCSVIYHFCRLSMGRSPGGGHGNPLQYSWLENPMDRGAWQVTVHSIGKSWTQLKQLSMYRSLMGLFFTVRPWSENIAHTKYSLIFFFLHTVRPQIEGCIHTTPRIFYRSICISGRGSD